MEAEWKKTEDLYQPDFDVLSRGLSNNNLSVPNAKMGMPKFSLTGSNESPGFMGNNPTAEITEAKTNKDELLAIETKFQQDMFNVKADAAESAIGLAKSAAGDNKALQIAIMAAEKALAISRIMINTEVAASAAIAAAASIPVGGVAIGAANAAAIRAMSYVSIGMVAASGILEGMDIAGKRAGGGPVRAGSTYLVGEQGPELMTATADGYITPNSALGGATYSPVFKIDARGSNLSEGQIRSIAKQAADQGKAEILDSMNRGGRFAVASGRMR